MDFDLTPAQKDLRDRAAGFVDEVLIPLEVRGRAGAAAGCPRRMPTRVRREARELGLVGGNHAAELGGQGWSTLEQVLVHEELGRNTNGVWWHMGGAYNVLAYGTPEQIERYLKPTLRGERADAYAVTEGEAGSDAGGDRRDGRAHRAGGWRMQGREVVRHDGRRRRTTTSSW